MKVFLIESDVFTCFKNFIPKYINNSDNEISKYLETLLTKVKSSSLIYENDIFIFEDKLREYNEVDNLELNNLFFKVEDFIDDFCNEYENSSPDEENNNVSFKESGKHLKKFKDNN
jgi:hypothetical protein